MSSVRFLLTVLALLVLTSPSLAVGVVAVSAPGAPVVGAADGNAPVPAFRPCERPGGKWVLPCQPDVGLPALAVTQTVWNRAPLPAPADEAMSPQRAPKADPPPPRHR